MVEDGQSFKDEKMDQLILIKNGLSTKEDLAILAVTTGLD